MLRAVGGTRDPEMRKMPKLGAGRGRRWSIRRSKDSDLICIRAWLKDQDRRGVEGSFLCNWGVIESAHRGRCLLVYVDGPGGDAIAYQVGGLIRPGILEVRADMRGQGIGARIVSRCIRDAQRSDECVLNIQCKPKASVPFWNKMGFQLHTDSTGRTFGYRKLEQAFSLPAESEPIEVSVRFFPTERLGDPSVEPELSLAPEAGMTPDGVVHLSRRAICVVGSGRQDLDKLVELKVGNQLVYFGKAKYQEANDWGVMRCTNAFYLDRLSTAVRQNLGTRS